MDQHCCHLRRNAHNFCWLRTFLFDKSRVEWRLRNDIWNFRFQLAVLWRKNFTYISVINSTLYSACCFFIDTHHIDAKKQKKQYCYHSRRHIFCRYHPRHWFLRILALYDDFYSPFCRGLWINDTRKEHCWVDYFRLCITVFMFRWIRSCRPPAFQIAGQNGQY